MHRGTTGVLELIARARRCSVGVNSIRTSNSSAPANPYPQFLCDVRRTCAVGPHRRYILMVGDQLNTRSLRSSRRTPPIATDEEREASTYRAELCVQVRFCACSRRMAAAEYSRQLHKVPRRSDATPDIQRRDVSGCKFAIRATGKNRPATTRARLWSANLVHP